jgi:hypothetical protein
MDAQRRDEMTDAALDRELQSLLGVEPSPGFVARVRTRIASEPSPSRSWFGAWGLLASAVVVAAIVLVAVNLPRPHRSNRPSSPLAARALAALRVPEVAPRLGIADEAPAVHVDRSTRTPLLAVAERRPPAEPEVLVDPREAAALRALIFGTRDGRIDLAPVLNASKPAVMELPPVGDIEIRELTIDPIAPATGEEGVRQ